MPRLPGETLRARIDRLGAMPVADATKLLRDIADALHYAHGAGVVHRDLQPRNLLVRENDGTVFLVHFTSAGRTGDESLRLPNPDAPEGTLLYMAPEQTGRTNRPVDHRAGHGRVVTEERSASVIPRSEATKGSGCLSDPVPRLPPEAR